MRRSIRFSLTILLLTAAPLAAQAHSEFAASNDADQRAVDTFFESINYIIRDWVKPGYAIRLSQIESSDPSSIYVQVTLFNRDNEAQETVLLGPPVLRRVFDDVNEDAGKLEKLMAIYFSSATGIWDYLLEHDAVTSEVFKKLRSDVEAEVRSLQSGVINIPESADPQQKRLAIYEQVLANLSKNSRFPLKITNVLVDIPTMTIREDGRPTGFDGFIIEGMNGEGQSSILIDFDPIEAADTTLEGTANFLWNIRQEFAHILVKDLILFRPIEAQMIGLDIHPLFSFERTACNDLEKGMINAIYRQLPEK